MDLQNLLISKGFSTGEAHLRNQTLYTYKNIRDIGLVLYLESNQMFFSITTIRAQSFEIELERHGIVPDNTQIIKGYTEITITIPSDTNILGLIIDAFIKAKQAGIDS